jgi:hypothetical protein
MSKPTRTHQLISALLLVLGIASGQVRAETRIDAPGELRIAVTESSARSEVIRRMGWAEQEFAKVNKRVVWVNLPADADARFEPSGALVVNEAVVQQKPDAVARLHKVVSRADAWITRRAGP